MSYGSNGVVKIEEAAQESVILELGEIQLALVGGGVGEVVFS